MKSIKILTGLLISIMLIGLVSAYSWPLPIGGKLTGENVANQLVETKNIRTGEVMSYLTSSSGEYMIDQINAKEGFFPGDTFEVKVVICSSISSACIKQVKYNGEVRLTINFDLGTTIPTPLCPPCDCGSCNCGSTGVIYKCTQEEAEKLVECKIPNPVIIKKDCPIDKTPFISCSSCCSDQDCENIPCEKEACPDVPEGLNNGQILIFILSMLGIGGAGIFAGKKLTGSQISNIKNVTYRIAVERDGDIREEHRHPGLKNYHSINVSHRETPERHPKGEKFPRYEKDVDGIYKYVGD